MLHLGFGELCLVLGLCLQIVRGGERALVLDLWCIVLFFLGGFCHSVSKIQHVNDASAPTAVLVDFAPAFQKELVCCPALDQVSSSRMEGFLV